MSIPTEDKRRRITLGRENKTYTNSKLNDLVTDAESVRTVLPERDATNRLRHEVGFMLVCATRHQYYLVQRHKVPDDLVSHVNVLVV